MSWFELSDDDQQDALVTLLIATDDRGPKNRQEAEKILDRSIDELEWNTIEEQLQEEMTRR